VTMFDLIYSLTECFIIPL